MLSTKTLVAHRAADKSMPLSLSHTWRYRPGEISSVWLSSLGCGVFDGNVQLGVAEVRNA